MYRNVEGCPQALRACCSHLLPKYALGEGAGCRVQCPRSPQVIFFVRDREAPREDTARRRAVPPGGAIPAGFA